MQEKKRKNLTHVATSLSQKSNRPSVLPILLVYFSQILFFNKYPFSQVHSYLEFSIRFLVWSQRRQLF